MKKILIISPSNKGTIASCTANIIKALKKYSDSKVFVLAIYREKEGLDAYEEGLFLVDRTVNTRNKMNYLTRLWKVWAFKKSIQPDITISSLLSVSSINILTSVHEKKIGIFHAPLDQTKNVSKLNYFLCKLSYKFLFTHLDYLYAVSETTKRDVQKHTGREVQLVYNIHDFDNINSKSQEPLTKDEQLIFNKKVVLYVGHLYDTKGIKRLLEAFSQVNSDSNLVLVGANSVEEIPDTYIMLAEDLKISNRTFFLGHQTNPYKYMKNCTVFVLPSYSEGLPGVLIEALSLNKKVITTNSSIGDWEIMQCYDCYKELLSEPYENELGFIVLNEDNNDESVKQLSSKIEFVLNQKQMHILPFDTSRFEGDLLVKYYTLDK